MGHLSDQSCLIGLYTGSKLKDISDIIWITVLNQLYSVGCLACDNRSYSSVKIKSENLSFQRPGSAEDLSRSPVSGCILFIICCIYKNGKS